MESLGKNAPPRAGETEAHLRLKRLALLWAQAHGYKICALEVSLPRCRYRADVAAYRPQGKRIRATAVFECKQAIPDLRRDNGSSELTRRRLDLLQQRRELLERNFRIHYPSFRIADSLFAEFDSHNFAAIPHRGYRSLARECRRLQNRLFNATKFETLIRYSCANLFFLVLPEKLFHESEIPLGWGVLVERVSELVLVRKAPWQNVSDENQTRFLERIAITGSRMAARKFGITSSFC